MRFAASSLRTPAEGAAGEPANVAPVLPIAILAGGLGTRLRPVTQTVPKALVPVNGRPFIDHQLALLRAHGITRAVVCVSYLGEMIEAHVKDGNAYGIDVAYSYDGAERVGTAGALKRALPLLGEAFFSIYGDSYLDCDYAAVQTAFEAQRTPALMTVYRNEGALGPSNVAFAGGMIAKYDKAHPTPDMRYIDFGLSVFRSDALGGVPADRATDLADVFAALAARGALAGYESPTRFYEVGSPDGVAELEALLQGSTGNR